MLEVFEKDWHKLLAKAKPLNVKTGQGFGFCIRNSGDCPTNPRIVWANSLSEAKRFYRQSKAYCGEQVVCVVSAQV